MSNVAVQTWDRLRGHRLVVGAGAFLRWWRTQLVEGLPRSWREKLQTERERLLIGLDEGTLRIGDASGRERLTLEAQGDRALAQQAVQQLLEELGEDRPEVRFLVPQSAVLQRQLTLPAAAEESLRQVLGFEMDRHTPFKAADVHFDCRVLERVAGGSRIRVQLYLMRRADGDGYARLCRERGLPLHAIDVAGEDGRPLGVNLLPPEQRAPVDKRQLRINLVLAALFLALLYGVMWQSVASREAALEDYRQRLAEVRAEAASVIALREELQAAAAAARFLSERKRSVPPVMNLLAELTRQLPDETHLQRMQINDQVVQISGETPEAARLITLLEQSPCLSTPSFKGAVTPHPQSGKERFTIEARISDGNCSHGPAAS